MVRDAAYKTWGCPAAVGCGSVVAELAIGRQPSVLLTLTPVDITRLAGGLPEGRAHCAELVVEAVGKAFDRAQG
jgi:NifU-like protein involved in Fe-S cluster formation